MQFKSKAKVQSCKLVADVQVVIDILLVGLHNEFVELYTQFNPLGSTERQAYRFTFLSYIKEHELKVLGTHLLKVVS